VKLKTAHFARQVPISGSYSPMVITMGATGHKDWVKAMEYDPTLRGIWITVEGSRPSVSEIGRHFVPIEQVLKMFPLVEDPAKATPVKKAG
jgi:hypothetical protein